MKGFAWGCLTLLWQFYSRLWGESQWRQNGHRMGVSAAIRARMARRMAGNVGCGGGPVSPSIIFSPLRQVGEAEILEEREGDHDQNRVMVQTMPTASLEVVETEFLLHLLVPLFADPARLDLPRQHAQRSIRRLVTQVVFGHGAHQTIGASGVAQIGCPELHLVRNPGIYGI
jgi:hypothetical protein